MKRILFSLILLTIACSRPAMASSSYTPGLTGFGISVGDFGGITLYHKLSEQSFVQAMISRYLTVAGDYAMTFPNAVPTIPDLTPFVGAGGFLFSTRYWDVYEDRAARTAGIGARIPLGVMFQIPNAPIHLHADITPSCTVIPFVESFLAVQLGVRFIL